MKFPPAFDIRKFSCMEKSPDEALVKKINQLEAENDRLKKEIESLNENLLQEFEKQKTKEVLITQQQQSRRRQSLLGLQLIPQEILEKLKEEGLICNLLYI